MKPLHDRVLVRGIEEVKTTASGIIMPGAAEKPSEGEVIAIGSGYRLMDGSIQALEVKVGDKVLFEKFGASEVKVGDEEFLMMREEKIIGILKS
jgi:chaperonin GroES